MKLTNEITVPAPIDEAWDLVLDVERVAPCLPGASIEGSEGDEYKGSMKVKIGPIVSQFKGTLKIEEASEEAHRAVMTAKARDSRGKGSANATITSTLATADEGTRVTVETDLRVTGPAASFGRGVMQDVSAMLMGQFADCLASKLGREAPGDEAEPAASAQAVTAGVPTPPEPETQVREPAASAAPAQPPTEEEEEVLDLGAVGRDALGKRVAGPAIGVVALLVLLIVLRRRSR
jgi:carbon monoxide dehydrogenase subunit G